MQRTNRSGAGGEKSLPCDPGSELQLGGREDRRAKNTNGVRKKKKKKKMVLKDKCTIDAISMSTPVGSDEPTGCVQLIPPKSIGTNRNEYYLPEE